MSVEGKAFSYIFKFIFPCLGFQIEDMLSPPPVLSPRARDMQIKNTGFACCGVRPKATRGKLGHPRSYRSRCRRPEAPLPHEARGDTSDAIYTRNLRFVAR